MTISNYKFCLMFIVLRLAATETLDGCKQSLGTKSLLDNCDQDPENTSFNSHSPINLSILDPSSKIESNEVDYPTKIPVNFTSIKIITAVATQGHTDESYVSQYKLMYVAPGSSTWKTYTHKNGSQFFEGNHDTASVVKHVLDPAIKASAVQFIPDSEQGKPICMKVEVYGCSDTDVVLKITPELNLADAIQKNLIWIILAAVIGVVTLSIICIAFYKYKKEKHQHMDTTNVVTYTKQRQEYWPELKPKTVQRDSSLQAHVVEPLIDSRSNSLAYGVPPPVRRADSFRAQVVEPLIDSRYNVAYQVNPSVQRRPYYQAQAVEPYIDHRYNTAYEVNSSTQRDPYVQAHPADQSITSSYNINYRGPPTYEEIY